MDLENWQTFAAPIIVLITLGLLVRRWVQSRKSGGCSQGCGCPVVSKTKPKFEVDKKCKRK